MSTQPFYVYEHRRSDTGAVFYVGKGKGHRLRVTQHRTHYWRAVAERSGWSAHRVVWNIDEELAHLAEVELIDVYRRRGIRLCNLTDGGEGAAGFRWDVETLKRRAAAQRGIPRPQTSESMRGKPKSPEHRANLAAAKRGSKASEEARQKMSTRRRGLGIPKSTCVFCGYVGPVPTLGRYHGPQCAKV